MNMHTIAPKSTAGLLSERAMLMTLNISQWSGRKFDRDVTTEVNRQHGASQDAGRYNKALLPKEALAGIQRVCGATRQWFVSSTAPWLNDGTRIKAVERYLEDSSKFQDFQYQLESEKRLFLDKYVDYKAEARRKLGDMYNEADYPTSFELEHKFGMAMRVMPVPTGDDFRVALGADEVARIRDDIERAVTEATQAAMQDVYKRVAEAVSTMAQKLSEYKPAGFGTKAEGIFRDSLVENVRDLIELLPGLNITGDPKLTELTVKLSDLTQYDADALRRDDHLRKSTAEQAQLMLGDISSMYA